MGKVYNINDDAFGFSIESVRRYGKKQDFFDEILHAYPDVDETKLKDVLEKVWSEAFPQGK
jgi:hypothetical protein